MASKLNINSEKYFQVSCFNFIHNVLLSRCLVILLLKIGIKNKPAG